MKVLSGGRTPMIFWMRKLLPVPAPPVMKTFLPDLTHSRTYLCSPVITAAGSALRGLPVKKKLLSDLRSCQTVH